MNNLERELKKVLGTKGDLDVSGADTRRKELERMILDKYELNMFKVKTIFWIFFLLSLGMMAGGYIGLRSAGSTKAMLSWVIFFMIGFNSTILLKLWYWVVNTKLNILKEMKQLQLQIAELADKEPRSQD